MPKIRKISSDKIILHENSQVTLRSVGNTQEVVFSAGNNTSCPIHNISKDMYLDKDTGEIKTKVHNTNRFQSPKSVRKSINKLMDLIKCNATIKENCVWVTLTYAVAMCDHKKVYEDGKLFMKRFQRYLNQQNYSEEQKN